MQGLLYTPKKSALSCISPNVPEALKHHLHILRIRRRVRWIPFYNRYQQSRPDHPNKMIGEALALICDQETLDRQGLPQTKRKEWQDAASDFTSTNQNISSATTVRRFSKTLRAYDNALHAYDLAEPKKPKHLEAIFSARWPYEGSACTAQGVAPAIAKLAATHFQNQDTVSKAPENQVAWQNFQATARVKQEAKHGFKLGFWLGVAMVAVVAVTVAAVVFSGGLAAIPVLAGTVAAHTAITTVAVGAAACTAPPIAIGGLFGSLGAGVQRLAEWGSRRVLVTNPIHAPPAPTAVAAPLEVVNSIPALPAPTAVPALVDSGSASSNAASSPTEVVVTNPIHALPAPTAVPAPVDSGSASSNAASSPTEVVVNPTCSPPPSILTAAVPAAIDFRSAPSDAAGSSTEIVVTNPIYALPAAVTVVPAPRGFGPAPSDAAGSSTAKLGRAGAPTGSLSDGLDIGNVASFTGGGPEAEGPYNIAHSMTLSDAVTARRVSESTSPRA